MTADKPKSDNSLLVAINLFCLGYSACALHY